MPSLPLEWTLKLTTPEKLVNYCLDNTAFFWCWSQCHTCVLVSVSTLMREFAFSLWPVKHINMWENCSWKNGGKYEERQKSLSWKRKILRNLGVTKDKHQSTREWELGLWEIQSLKFEQKGTGLVLITFKWGSTELNYDGVCFKFSLSFLSGTDIKHFKITPAGFCTLKWHLLESANSRVC